VTVSVSGFPKGQEFLVALATVLVSPKPRAARASPKMVLGPFGVRCRTFGKYVDDRGIMRKRAQLGMATTDTDAVTMLLPAHKFVIGAAEQI
jgi:hypothetical protein